MPALAASQPTNRPVKTTETLAPVYAGAGLVVLVAWVAQRAVDGHLYPGCGFRWLTGQPCPGCGGTRSLAALAELNIAEAFFYNPLAAALAIGAFVLLPFAVADQMLNQGRLSGMLRAMWGGHRWLRRVIIAGLVSANWAYVLQALD